MKLLFNFTLIVFFFSMTACGGGGQKNEGNKDSTATDSTAESKEVKETPDTSATDMSSAEAKMLVKKWQMVSFMHTDGRKKDNIDNAFIEFKSDGTFDEIFNGQSVSSGKWKLSEDKKNIVLMQETGEFKGKDKMMEVKELKEDMLTTLDDDGKMTEVYKPAK